MTQGCGPFVSFVRVFTTFVSAIIQTFDCVMSFKIQVIVEYAGDNLSVELNP